MVAAVTGMLVVRWSGKANPFRFWFWRRVLHKIAYPQRAQFARAFLTKETLVKFKLATAVLVTASALLGLAYVQAQGTDYGTIVLKVPADANVVISGAKTMQKGSVRTFYTPTLEPGWKYQYEVKVTWMEGGKEKTRTEWVDVTPGKATNLDWAPAGTGKKDDAKKDDVKKESGKKETGKKDDVKKEETKKEGTKKDDVKKETGKKDDVKKDDVKKDSGKKDDVKKDDAKKEGVKKDDVKKETGKKETGKKEDAKKEDGKKEASKEKKDDVKKSDTGKSGDETGFVKIFNGKDMSGFKTTVSGKDKNPFEVKDGVIDVSGNPAGYFYTDKSYKNYILRFDWKFLKDGNSGLLIHIQEPHKIWPKSVEVQGMQKDHGNIFAIGGAKGTFKKNAAAQKEAIKIGEWNTTEVISENGKLTAKVNGVEVSSGEGDLREGPLGWQSEGAPLQFKNIRIKVLD